MAFPYAGLSDARGARRCFLQRYPLRFLIARAVLSLLAFVAPVSVIVASPQPVTFASYHPKMGFRLRCSASDKGALIFYALQFDSSFGPRPCASLKLVNGETLEGKLDLISISLDADPEILTGYGKTPKARVVAFQLSRDLSKGAVLMLTRDIVMGPTAFEVMLSTWPVEIIRPRHRKVNSRH